MPTQSAKKLVTYDGVPSVTHPPFSLLHPPAFHSSTSWLSTFFQPVSYLAIIADAVQKDETEHNLCISSFQHNSKNLKHVQTSARECTPSSSNSSLRQHNATTLKMIRTAQAYQQGLTLFVCTILYCLFGNADAFSLLHSTTKASSPRARLATESSNSGEDSSTTKIDSCDVAIFGGGFGGLYTALALAEQAKRQKQPLDICLVEPSESFVFLPLLYDLTVGTATEAEVCPSYRELLANTGVRQIKASLESIEKQMSNGAPTTAILKRPSGGPNAPPTQLQCQKACVIAVGASPASILSRVPGALEYAQPFYTAQDAKQTRRLLAQLEDKCCQTTSQTSSVTTTTPTAVRVAIVGGGFGGVELAASVQRRLPHAQVTLLSRGPPMAGTRAEPLIEQALQRLGVTVEECSVDALMEAPQGIIVKRTAWKKSTSSEDEKVVNDDEPWDSVMWTAGSAPAHPVGGEEVNWLRKSNTGRLAVDSTLQCLARDDGELGQPAVWALGDCAEIVLGTASNQPAVPKTAQAAMQQADVVAFNLLRQLDTSKRAPSKEFQYQDLGSMLTLGGPNAAVMAPKEGSFLAPFFTPALDVASAALGMADQFLEGTVGKSPVLKRFGLDAETIGLSLGSYGLGVESGAAPGTLAGTLTGGARRAVYAARMPTNRQRAVAATSAAIATAAALAKEASARNALEKNK